MSEMSAEPLIAYTEKYTQVPERSDEKDNVNSPSHYQTQSSEVQIECIDAMRAAFGDEVVEDFCIANAMKYLWRHQRKGGTESVKKAQWYLNKYIELKEKDV